MPAPDWKQALETGQDFTELTRTRARRLAERLVEQGQIGRNQVQSAADELVARSKQRTAALRRLVDDRVQAQLRALGVATRRDLAELERRLVKEMKSTPRPATARAASRSTARKAPAKRAAKTASATKARAARAASRTAASGGGTSAT